MTTTVRIDFCCNDPDNGLPAGRVCGLQLQDMELELEARDMRGPVFREAGSAVRVGRRQFVFEWSKDWFGNWCWNAYWFDIDVAVELLAWLHGQGTFSASSGEERLFSRWENARLFSSLDRDFLRYRLTKAKLAEQAARKA